MATLQERTTSCCCTRHCPRHADKTQMHHLAGLTKMTFLPRFYSICAGPEQMSLTFTSALASAVA